MVCLPHARQRGKNRPCVRYVENVRSELPHLGLNKRSAAGHQSSRFPDKYHLHELFSIAAEAQHSQASRSSTATALLQS